MDALLAIRNVSIYFHTFWGIAKAVDGISFEVSRGSVLGLVGESGSGKSVTGMAILRLIQPPGRIMSGDILFEDKSILALSEAELRAIRGGKISMIFQNPRTCLNPVLSIGEQIDRVYRQHSNASRREARERRLEMLQKVGIGDPIRFSNNYPHQISGGMCQRAMIVMALICNPSLVIADEPTTGLDVTIQKQILELLGEMRSNLNTTQILITHDLGVVAETCDHVVVLYAGKVMEIASTRELFAKPSHPYTLGLLKSIPRLDLEVEPIVLPGYVPSAINRPSGCPFHPRCYLAEPICKQDMPEMVEISPGHLTACHFSERV